MNSTVGGQFRFTPVPALDDCAVEWAMDDSLIISCGNALYRCNLEGGNRQLLGAVPRPMSARLVSRVRLGRRFLREMFYNVIPLANGRLFATFARDVGFFVDTRFQPLSGIRRSTRVLRGGCAVAPDGSVYWGEYFDNDTRGEVYVYRWDPRDDRAEVAYVFGRGQIYHVHSIQRDPFDESLLCLTGDRKMECRFLRTRDGFRTIDAVGEGDERWRFVSVVPRADSWLVATDAEFTQNEISRLDRRTGERTRLGVADGPVYYSAQAGDTTFFGSTAERCDIQPQPRATLYAVRESRVEAVRTFPKDLGASRLAWKLFLPGTLHFPLNSASGNRLYVSGVGLRGFDSRVMRVDWSVTTESKAGIRRA
jgi:hypothetical protein